MTDVPENESTTDLTFEIDWTERLRRTCQTSPYIAAIKMLFQLLQYLKLLNGQLLPSAHFSNKERLVEEGVG